VYGIVTPVANTYIYEFKHLSDTCDGLLLPLFSPIVTFLFAPTSAMSRNPSDKKPVAFATHITAGGAAGAMEAVRRRYLLCYELFNNIYCYSAMLPTT
jgi:hypothetical protein